MWSCGGKDYVPSITLNLPCQNLQVKWLKLYLDTSKYSLPTRIYEHYFDPNNYYDENWGHGLWFQEYILVLKVK